jgi:hypothetical protein
LSCSCAGEQEQRADALLDLLSGASQISRTCTEPMPELASGDFGDRAFGLSSLLHRFSHPSLITPVPGAHPRKEVEIVPNRFTISSLHPTMHRGRDVA